MTHKHQFGDSDPVGESAEGNTYGPGTESLSKGLSRRSLLKSLAGAAAGLLPPVLLGMGAQVRSALAKEAGTTVPVKNPAWFGFNLLEYFSTDPDWMKYFPYKNDGMFREDDFRWIRDWGFNFVRLPMDYRFWTNVDDLITIIEKQVELIDRAIRLGEKYGIHVNICLHRAPGECILDGMDEAITGIHITKEKTSVYEDARTLDAFVHQWTYFAQRYRGIPNERLSFNLVNEPKYRTTAAEEVELKTHDPEDSFSREFRHLRELQYVRVARAAIEGIRAHDPQRLIVTDGYPGANSPIPELFDTHIIQNCHTYVPTPLTHYQCEWARSFFPPDTPVPTWPLKDRQGRVYDRAALAAIFRPWADLPRQGIPIHFGEMGAYKHTPPNVVLAWFDDTLSVLNDLHTGWALWNFRGPNGILDTERSGTRFEDWHGHQLDRPLLNLLQKRMKM
ncbi:MAG: cellulase family glycosylhydrolase [Acidobacteriota bacterium]|nr:cellulase family glycosylhydrolase [Acidobacteriota bacterium]